MNLQTIGSGLSFVRDFSGNAFPQLSNMADLISQSTSMSLLIHKAIQNIPYVIFADKLQIKDVEHMTRSRLSYFESTVVSTALLIYHLTIYMFSFVLVILTFGLSEGINTVFKESSFQTAFSFYSLLISSCGVIFPSLGVYFSLLFVKANWEQLQSSYKNDFKNLNEAEFVKTIQEGWWSHKKEVCKAVKNFLVNIKWAKETLKHERELSAMFAYIDQALGKARTIQEIFDIVKKVVIDREYSKDSADPINNSSELMSV